MVNIIKERTEIFEKASTLINASEISKHVKSIARSKKCRDCDKELSQDPNCLYCLAGDNKQVIQDLKVFDDTLTDKELKVFLDILNNKKLSISKINREEMKYNKMLYSFILSYNYHKYI